MGKHKRIITCQMSTYTASETIGYVGQYRLISAQFDSIPVSYPTLSPCSTADDLSPHYWTVIDHRRRKQWYPQSTHSNKESTKREQMVMAFWARVSAKKTKRNILRGVQCNMSVEIVPWILRPSFTANSIQRVTVPNGGGANKGRKRGSSITHQPTTSR